MQASPCHEGICAIGVMAKAPQPGRSKTRLCPPLSHHQAAALSAAFLRDVTENIALAAREAPIAGLIAFAAPGSEALFDGHLADGTGMVLADGSCPAPDAVGGFGRCLLHAMRSMLGAGYGAACVLNSDSPTLPTATLVQAASALLRPGRRVVLGAAEDGGYYLLGATGAHAHLFADIAWSTDSVAAATRVRAAELGLELVELAPWYDVDDRGSLARLLDETAGHAPPADHQPGAAPYAARATAAAIERLGLRAARLTLAAQ